MVAIDINFLKIIQETLKEITILHSTTYTYIRVSRPL